MSVWWTQVKCQERCRVNFFIEKSGICSRTHQDNIHNSSPIYMVNHSWMFKIGKGRKFMICLCASDPKNRTKLYYRYIIAVYWPSVWKFTISHYIEINNKDKKLFCIIQLTCTPNKSTFIFCFYLWNQLQTRMQHVPKCSESSLKNNGSVVN